MRTSAERALAPACIWGSVGIFKISFGRRIVGAPQDSRDSRLRELKDEGLGPI